MTSDSSIKDQFFSMMKSKLTNPLSFRQTVSTTTQADGTVSSVKPPHAFRTLTRSSTTNLLTGSAEPQSDHRPGHTPSPGNSLPPEQPRSINVVLFGETGVGKSSVINLIARKEVAKVSSDVNGCTMQSTRYDISFDNMDFAIFDTIGLEEPQMGVNGYLKAIERAYELIMKLGAAGGIHLLLFCMRGGRITATTQSNYRLFCECLCSTKVPIALVFTGLEREVEMEDWWTRNKTHIEGYGIKSDGHACITAVQDDTPGEDLKYTESQKRIRDLLKTCALKNEAFLPEQYTWFARLGKGMRSFIEKHRNPKRRDVMRVLTRRCKLDPETARKIADMMEKGDTEKTGDDQDGQAENREVEGGSDPAPGKDENEGMRTNTAEVEPRSADVLERKDKGEVANEKVAKNRTSAPPPSGIEVEPRIVALEGKKDKGGVANEKAAKNRTLAIPQNDVETESRTVALEGKDKAEVANEKVAKSRISAIPQNDVEAGPRAVGLEGKDKGGVTNEKVTRNRVLAIPQNDVKVVPRPVGLEGRDKGGVANEKVTRNRALAIPQNDVRVEPRTVGLEGKDGRQPKVKGDGGEQSLDTGLVQQVKSQRNDTKPQPRAASTVRSSGSSRRAIYIPGS